MEGILINIVSNIIASGFLIIIGLLMGQIGNIIWNLHRPYSPSLFQSFPLHQSSSKYTIHSSSSRMNLNELILGMQLEYRRKTWEHLIVAMGVEGNGILIKAEYQNGLLYVLSLKIMEYELLFINANNKLRYVCGEAILSLCNQGMIRMSAYKTTVVDLIYSPPFSNKNESRIYEVTERGIRSSLKYKFTIKGKEIF